MNVLFVDRMLGKSDDTKCSSPSTVAEARKLATQGEGDGRFEFEKWVCGVLGTSNMFQRKKPGERGGDGGVDGLLKFFPIRLEGTEQTPKADEAYAVIQVKSGKVTPDAVRALTQVIEDTPKVLAAVLVCFADQRTTVEKWRNKSNIEGILGEYPKVQCLTIEELLQLPNNPAFLPNIVKTGGKTEAIQLSHTEPPDQLKFRR
ncbi:MAG: hypothetical protein OXI96_01040 [Acidimicrobiaceae bacterium]|nr:hypothetical protein [Acidimicrobiaceae bacterium]